MLSVNRVLARVSCILCSAQPGIVKQREKDSLQLCRDLKIERLPIFESQFLSDPAMSNFEDRDLPSHSDCDIPNFIVQIFAAILETPSHHQRSVQVRTTMNNGERCSSGCVKHSAHRYSIYDVRCHVSTTQTVRVREGSATLARDRVVHRKQSTFGRATPLREESRPIFL